MSQSRSILIVPKGTRLGLRVPIDITFDLRHTVRNGVTQSSGRRDLCSSRGSVVLDQLIRAGQDPGEGIMQVVDPM